MSKRGGKVIFVGNLPGDIREREVEDLFYKYGPIVDIDLKIPPRPPAYAYVEFEDARDAEEAMRGRDGYKFDGERLRVEMAHFGRGGAAVRERPSSQSSGPRGGRGAAPRRSEYRVMVTDLPSSASWQDLKDHMRRAGDVCFSDVYREGGGTVGVVDYTNYDDMKYAIEKLDDSEFRNAFSRGYIRVKEYDSKRSLSRSKSRSRSRSNTRSPSPSRSRSRSPRPPGKKSTRRSLSRSVSRSPGKKSTRQSLSRSVSRSPGKKSTRRSLSRSFSRSPGKKSTRWSLSRSVSRSRSRSRSPDASAGKKAGSMSPKERSPRRDRSVSRSPSPVKSE